MFKRLVLIIVCLFTLSIFILGLFWQHNTEAELYSGTSVSSYSRLVQDLSGKWNEYSSLKEALLEENNAGNQNNNLIDRISGDDSIVLPSNGEFKVVAKEFKVNSKWGSRNSVLALNGVYGKVRVYLNGIKSVNLIGEFEGYGETHYLEIQPSRFDYGKNNKLFIEIVKGGAKDNLTLDSINSAEGRITGKIVLEAVAETSIDLEHTTFAFDPGKNRLTVSTALWHHESLKNGPWTLQGKLIQNNAVIAQCLLPVASDGSYKQTTKLIFDLSNASLWSPTKPELYELELTVSNVMGDQDTIQLPVGMRTVSEQNGKILLNKADYKVIGAALTSNEEALIRHDSGQEAWLQEKKKNGVNTIYFTDNYPDESWFFYADKIGIGIWAEMPYSMIPSEKGLEQDSLKMLVNRAERHPSLLAWTVMKGLDGTSAESARINELRELAGSVPTFALDFQSQAARYDGLNTINAQSQTLSGNWGSISAETRDQGSSWPQEKIAAIIWTVVCIFVAFQCIRCVSWQYKELDNDSPKRKLRRAFFWSSVGFICRMLTLGAILVDILFRIPRPLNYWLQGEWTVIPELQAQYPFLLIVTGGFFLALCRLMQTGVAARAFPGNPEALSLTCWLERRYVWFPLVAAAWVSLFWGIPFYVPIALYFMLTILAFPIRFRDCRRIKAKYRYLLIVPLFGIMTAVIAAIWNFSYLMYLYRVFII